MTAPKWADYSAGYPGGAALVAAGFVGIIAYVGLGSGPKLITAADYQDAIAHGLRVLLVAELDIRDAEGGYPAGVTNAQKALADARSKGIPDSVGIAATCDEHLTPAQISTCVDYVRGFRDVLGQARTGAYGFAEFVDAVHSQGYAGWWWKSGAAPTASESQWVTFWQQNTGAVVVNKISVDVDQQFNPVGADLTPEEHTWQEAILRMLQSIYVYGFKALPADLTTVPPWQNGGDLSWLDRREATQLTAEQATDADVKAKTLVLAPDQIAALQSAVSSAVTAAVSGLSLAVSPADVVAVAKATADEFAKRLAV
jgi:Domain of unknown function (DUF1906)